VGLVAAALVAAVAAVRDRLPRVTGWLVAVLYLEWMVVAMSYGKVDHDRFAFLVALFVLPSVGSARCAPAPAPRRRLGAEHGRAGRRRDLRAGGGREAALRRAGTGSTGPPSCGPSCDAAPPCRAVAAGPQVLHAAQYGIMVMELLVAPLLLVRWRDPRTTWLLAAGFLGFHLLTFAMITIVFLPHCVALLALLPLERLVAARPPVPV
jgi:hypothetical protein